MGAVPGVRQDLSIYECFGELLNTGPGTLPSRARPDLEKLVKSLPLPDTIFLNTKAENGEKDS